MLHVSLQHQFCLLHVFFQVQKYKSSRILIKKKPVTIIKNKFLMGGVLLFVINIDICTTFVSVTDALHVNMVFEMIL